MVCAVDRLVRRGPGKTVHMGEQNGSVLMLLALPPSGYAYGTSRMESRRHSSNSEGPGWLDCTHICTLPPERFQFMSFCPLLLPGRAKQTVSTIVGASGRQAFPVQEWQN